MKNTEFYRGECKVRLGMKHVFVYVYERNGTNSLPYVTSLMYTKYQYNVYNKYLYIAPMRCVRVFV